MAEFKPVTSIDDLCTLDNVEIMEGYSDGLRDEPEPGSNRSRSYWHGWRNGMRDKGRLPSDEGSRALAREALEGDFVAIFGFRQ